jgi:hydrogenase-4 component H
VLKLLREVFRVGEATVQYPFAPLDVTPGFRGRPQYDPDLCIVCAACALACPSNAIAIATDVVQGVRTWSLSYGRCIYCARCEEVCPVHAIALTQDFEMAVARKEDLLVKAHFQLASCRICGIPFAAQKEVAYVHALLTGDGMSPELAEEQRAQLMTCPECRRAQDVAKVAHLAPLARQGAAR